MKRLFIAFYCLLITFSVYAQIGGKVIDGRTTLPLSGVHIYLQKDSTKLGITNENGYFDTLKLSSLKSEDTLVFSHVGYQHVRYTRKDLSTNKFQVNLLEKIQHLEEVTVSSKKYSYFLECVPLASLPNAVFSFGSFLDDEKIYVVGGDETDVSLFGLKSTSIGPITDIGIIANRYQSPDLLVYDISEDKWSIHKKVFKSRACHAAHLYKNKIYIIGGKNYSTNRKKDYTNATLEVYDLKKETLLVDPVNPHQAVNFTSFIYDDCLFMIGGAVKQNVYSSKIHALHLSTGIWYEIGRIPLEFQREMNGVRIDDTVYLLGGRRNGTPTYRIDTYNLLTEEWKHLSDLGEAVAYPSLAHNGNEIYIFEGKTLQIYDIKTNKVTVYPVPDSSVPTNNDTGRGALENSGLFFWKNKLYIVGGRVFENSSTRNFFKPSSNVYSINLNQVKTRMQIQQNQD